MATIHADNVIYFFIIFGLIMLAYGVNQPTIANQNTLNVIFAPFPTFGQVVNTLASPGQRSCGLLDFGCQASNGIATATAYVGAVLSYPTILLFSVLSRINAMGALFIAVTFGPGNSLSAIPFGLLFILAPITVVGISVFRWVRGVGAGF